MSEPRRANWIPLVSLSLKIGIVLALGYAAYDYFTRPAVGERQARRESPLQADLYVHPKRTHIGSYSTAQRLVGMELWTKEGWRWATEPGGRRLEPLEKVVPTRVATRGDELRLAFQRDGRTESVQIGGAGRVWVDEIFFIEEPRELYSHWTEEDWERIARGEAWAGMSEMQAIFSLGAGRPVDVSPGGETRIVEFAGRPEAPALLIRFRKGIADEVNETDAPRR